MDSFKSRSLRAKKQDALPTLHLVGFQVLPNLYIVACQVLRSISEKYPREAATKASVQLELWGLHLMKKPSDFDRVHESIYGGVCTCLTSVLVTIDNLVTLLSRERQDGAFAKQTHELIARTIASVQNTRFSGANMPEFIETEASRASNNGSEEDMEQTISEHYETLLVSIDLLYDLLPATMEDLTTAIETNLTDKDISQPSQTSREATGGSAKPARSKVYLQLQRILDALECKLFPQEPKPQAKDDSVESNILLKNFVYERRRLESLFELEVGSTDHREQIISKITEFSSRLSKDGTERQSTLQPDEMPSNPSHALTLFDANEEMHLDSELNRTKATTEFLKMISQETEVLSQQFSSSRSTSESETQVQPLNMMQVYYQEKHPDNILTEELKEDIFIMGATLGGLREQTERARDLCVFFEKQKGPSRIRSLSRSHYFNLLGKKIEEAREHVVLMWVLQVQIVGLISKNCLHKQFLQKLVGRLGEIEAILNTLDNSFVTRPDGQTPKSSNGSSETAQLSHLTERMGTLNHQMVALYGEIVEARTKETNPRRKAHRSSHNNDQSKSISETFGMGATASEPAQPSPDLAEGAEGKPFEMNESRRRR